VKVQHGQCGTSRSFAIYGLLLKLDPRPYLQQHRAELLQNFEDLEQASRSTIALWLFIGKDLRSQFTKTLWGQTAIAVIVLAVLVREHRAEGFCCGYILGWFAGWSGKRWQASSVGRVANGIRSSPAQAMIVVSVLVLVIAVAGVGSGIQNPDFEAVGTIRAQAVGGVAAMTGKTVPCGREERRHEGIVNIFCGGVTSSVEASARRRRIYEFARRIQVTGAGQLVYCKNGLWKRGII
jgi:hypothetical protein